MKAASWVFAAVLAITSVVRSQAQLVLRAGESYTYQFSDLPFLYYVERYPFVPHAELRFNVIPGSVAPDTTLRWEMFHDSPDQAPFHSGVVTQFPPYDHSEAPFPGWDRQGAYRLTVLTGSLILGDVMVGAQELTGLSRVNIYAATNVPPPRVVYRRLDNIRIELSWTTNALEYRLEQLLPGATAWSLVPNTVTTNGADYVVNIATAGPRRFFRLQRP